jgi:hypothetical protein
MIHEAATTTAAKSDVPFAPEAVTMLEQVRAIPWSLSRTAPSRRGTRGRVDPLRLR